MCYEALLLWDFTFYRTFIVQSTLLEWKMNLYRIFHAYSRWKIMIAWHWRLLPSMLHPRIFHNLLRGLRIPVTYSLRPTGSWMIVVGLPQLPPPPSLPPSFPPSLYLFPSPRCLRPGHRGWPEEKWKESHFLVMRGPALLTEVFHFSSIRSTGLTASVYHFICFPHVFSHENVIWYVW